MYTDSKILKFCNGADVYDRHQAQTSVFLVIAVLLMTGTLAFVLLPWLPGAK